MVHVTCYGDGDGSGALLLLLLIQCLYDRNGAGIRVQLQPSILYILYCNFTRKWATYITL